METGATGSCTRCGHVLTRSDRYCAGCGGAILHGNGPPPPPSYGWNPAQVASPPTISGGRGQPDSSNVQIVIGFGVALLVTGLVIGWLVLRERTSSESVWPEQVEADFLDECYTTSGGELDYCRCAYREVQDRLSLSEYLRTGSIYSSTGQPTAEMADVDAACIQLVSGPPLATVSQAPAAPALTREDLESLVPSPKFSLEAGDWILTSNDISEVICIAVAWENVGLVDGTPALFLLSLVRPSGQITTSTVGPDFAAPPSEEVVPGASGSFDLCFETANERGEFILRYEDTTHSEVNNEWTVTVP